MENEGLSESEQGPNLASLIHISQAVTGSVDLYQMLRTACKSIVNLLGVSHSGFVLFDPDLERGIVYAEYPDIGTKDKVIPLGDVPAHLNFVKHREPVIIPEVRNDASLGPAQTDLVKLGIRSMLLVPVVSKGRLLGSFGLDMIGETRTFKKEEIELCQAFATQVAMAIEGAQLAQALEELHKVSLDITGRRQLSELTKSILDRAVSLLSARGGGLYLLDRMEEHVKLAAVSKLPKEMLGNEWVVGKGVIGQVIKTRAPFAVNDYQHWEDRLPELDRFGVTAVAGAPILAQGKLWGVIAVHDVSQNRKFSRDELSLLWHLGNMAAVAYENARREDERERLIASSFDAIIRVNEKGEVVEFNKPAEEILGRTAAEVLEKSVVPLYYPEGAARDIKRRLVQSKEGRIADYLTSVRGSDGKEIPIRLSASLLYNSEKEPAGSVGFFRDLREIHQLKDLLAAARAITSRLNLASVLQAICSNAMKALHDVDLIILYPYNSSKRLFDAEPVSSGEVNSAFFTGRYSENSVLLRLVEHGIPHFANYSTNDSLMTGNFVKRENVVSSAGVPLKVGTNLLGIMFFNYRKPHPFSIEDKDVINILANQAAIAIENARLYGETDKARKAAELVAAVMALGDIKRTLTSITNSALAVVECDAVVLYEYDQIKEKLNYPPTHEGLPYSPDKWPYPEVSPDSIAYKALAKKLIESEEVDKDPRFQNSVFAKQERIKSCVAIALMADGEIVGVMFVNYFSYHKFTDVDLTNIRLFANQASVAISNAQRYETSRRDEGYRTALYNAAKTITVSLTLGHKKVLDRIVEQAVECVGIHGTPKAHLGTIELFDEGTNELSFESVFPIEKFSSLVKHIGKQRRLDRADKSSKIGVSGRAVLDKKAQIVPDVRADHDYRVYDAETRSELAVPLLDQGKVLGVLNIEGDKLGAFDTHDLSALEALAEFSVVAIQSSRIRGMVGARIALAWLGMMSTTWRHSIVGDALAIRDTVPLLRKELTRLAKNGRLSLDVDEKLERIERFAAEISEKPITPPLSSEEGVNSVSIDRLIRDRVRELWNREPYKGVEHELILDFESHRTVRASAEWLRRAFDIVIDNGVEATTISNRRPHLKIVTRYDNSNVEIAVMDSGGGISKEAQPVLFREPIRKAKGSKGLGIGLLIAQAILETYRGEIRLDATGSAGTTFVIRLPLEPL